jgi:phage shock protein C
MNPFEMLFVPMVLFMVIVAPIWIVMHYRSVNRSSSQLSEEDRQALEDLLVAVDQMAERIDSLESILEADRSEGWVGGVCAGLAAHWDVPNWVVRLAAVALLMFTGSLAFWLYVFAWVAIAPKASRWSELPDKEIEIDMEYDEDRHTYRRKTVFRYTDAPAERVRKAKERVAKAAERIEAMERYVTSRKYDLNREFSRL